jgi:hypothetical protein
MASYFPEFEHAISSKNAERLIGRCFENPDNTTLITLYKAIIVADVDRKLALENFLCFCAQNTKLYWPGFSKEELMSGEGQRQCGCVCKCAKEYDISLEHVLPEARRLGLEYYKAAKVIDDVIGDFKRASGQFAYSGFHDLWKEATLLNGSDNDAHKAIVDLFENNTGYSKRQGVLQFKLNLVNQIKDGEGDDEYCDQRYSQSNRRHIPKLWDEDYDAVVQRRVIVC